MTPFDLTKSAKADLKAISRYTQERRGIPQRNTYFKEVDQLFRALASNPEMGRACVEIRAGYWKFPHGAHVIYYEQLAQEDLLIVRILPETMDVESHLGA